MFFGASEVHREIPGFSVSLLSPTLRAEDVPLHCHQNASFVLVLAGTYLSSADGADRISLPSTLFFNPAGTTHRDAFELAEGQFLAVSLSEQSCRIAAECGKLPTAATAFRRGAVVETAFRLARQCSQSESDSDSLGILEGLCWELLSNVAGRELWSEKVLPSWLRQAKELLRDQCSEPLLISGLARQLGVHPVYLARTFRKAFGCTPGEYLARCRLRKAMALLRESSLPLAEIALATGFFDQSHFSRTFRQHFGVAPHAYRKRLASR
jgi:AraC family transcriptional regulator